MDECAFVRAACKTVFSSDRSLIPDEAKRQISRKVDLNQAAAGYLLDLCEALEVATERLSLSGFGKAIRATNAGADLQLSRSEQLLFLALFLRTDALVLSQIAAACVRLDAFSTAQLGRTGVIEEAFRRSFDVVIAEATLVQDKVRLKQLQQKLPQQYVGKTIEHKLDVRVRLLYRVGLLRRERQQYKANSGLNRLARMSEDLPMLARKIRDGGALDLALDVLASGLPIEHAISEREIAAAFFAVEGNAGRIAEIEPLTFYMSGRLFAESKRVGTAAIVDAINNAAKLRPADFRLHVNRNGKRTLLSVSRRLLESSAHME